MVRQNKTFSSSSKNHGMVSDHSSAAQARKTNLSGGSGTCYSVTRFDAMRGEINVTTARDRFTKQ
jgi:hypothetical protein